MPFVTEAIAQRVETTAAAFLLRGALQVQAMPGDPLGIEIGRFGPVVAYRQRRRHELPRYNHAIVTGPGFAGYLVETLAFFEEAGVPPRDAPGSPIEIEVCSLFLEGQGRGLAEAGYRVGGTAAIHAGEPRAPAPVAVPAGIVIRDSPGEEIARWVQGWNEGFGTREEYRELQRGEREALFSGPGFRRYLALRVDEVVGVAGLFVDGETALLDPSAVLPEARGQGIHAAFIAQRLTDAAEAGCDLAFVGTRLASGSHRNQRRAGLELAYERLIFQRDR
jgi:GNAT superfamily N-acetyltransferase